MLAVRSTKTRASSIHQWQSLTQSVLENEPAAARRRRGATDVRCNGTANCRCTAHSVFEYANAVALDEDGGESVGAKLAALIGSGALVCLNIHTFWSHSTRVHTFEFGNETVEFLMCNIPARTGWFFQRVWPRVEGSLSELAPAAFLLPLALYGMCALCFAPNERNPQPPSPTVAVATRSAVSSPRARHVDFSEGAREPENDAIESVTPVPDATPACQQAFDKCRAIAERREQLRLVLLLALLTSAIALQEGAMELMPAIGPRRVNLSTREWLLVLLASHTLSLLAQCATLPLCLLLSARFRRHFCALLCFCVRRRNIAAQCETLSSYQLPHGSHEN